MIIVFNPFFFSFGILLVAFRHQSSNDFSSLVGVRSCSPKGVRIRDQNSLARTHVLSRCWTVSSSWSHKGQWVGWGNPLLAKQSAVQHLFWIANHKNNLHFACSLDFHRCRQGAKAIEPLKNARYADFEVNWPDPSSLQTWTPSSWERIVSCSIP